MARPHDDGLLLQITMIEFKYRPDVDGLRAVAVVLVLLFHAGLGFQGGFIGVDVFFVISGYLITGLILQQQEAGIFSLRTFWIRRIRRIVPAATVMAVGVLLAGSVLLLPEDYVEVAESVVAQQFILSNVYFWQSTGYFEGPADLQPMLHTWSLAVEEQFYLVFPLLLIVLRRYRRRVAMGALVLLGLGSLVLSEVGVRQAPTAAFFLLPTRAWEMILGGLIWCLPAPTKLPGWFLGLCSWLSLGSLVTAAWWLQPTMPFPGFTALLPCGAAAVLIYCNSGRLTLPAKVLASRPVVFVGLLSYSLYLWHWPILVFCRHVYGETLSPWMGAACLALSWVAAYSSWRWVECPLRSERWLPDLRRNGVLVATSMTLLVGGSCWIWCASGMHWRLPADKMEMVATAQRLSHFQRNTSGMMLEQRSLPQFGDPNGGVRLLVWGDSHAMHLLPGLDEVCQDQGILGFQATHSATAPLLGYHLPSRWGIPEHQADEFSQGVVQFVQDSKIDVVLMAANWGAHASAADFSEKLLNTVTQLNEAGSLVVLLRDVPRQDHDLVAAAGRAAIQRGEIQAHEFSIEAPYYKSKESLANEIFDLLPPSLVQVLDPAPCFVKEGRWRVGEPGVSFYRDRSHLSDLGSRQLNGLFSDFFASHESVRVSDRRP